MSQKPQPSKNSDKLFNPSQLRFLYGFVSGAISITAVVLFGKYINNKNDYNLPPQKTIEEEKQETENQEEEKKDDIKPKDIAGGGDGEGDGGNKLLNDEVYKKLFTTINPQNKFYYQYCREHHKPYVMAINILVEYLPNSMIEILFSYVMDTKRLKQFNLSKYLQNGWEGDDDKLHDSPDIYVENVAPISNQPSIILTIGLPGSGKTTWAKIRLSLSSQSQYVYAADDYFDKFNAGTFDGRLIGKAHEWCRKEIFCALRNGHCVCANNTNTTLPELHAYVTKVLFSKLPHKIVFVMMPEMNINTLSKRGIHGVPVRTLKDMTRRIHFWKNKEGKPSIRAVLKAGEFRRWGSKKGISKDCIYTGIFTEEATKKSVREYFVNISGKPLLCDTMDVHLTLKYQPLYSDVDRLPFGKKVYMKIVGYATHEYVQCFIVDILDDDIRRLCTNKYPHITISCNRSILGPQYSSNLLEDGQVIPTVNNFDVRNTANYDDLYRNYKKNKNGGGLIIEGTVGGYYKQPFGIVTERQQPQYNDEYNNEYNANGQYNQKSQQQPWIKKGGNKKRNRKRGRSRTKNQNKMKNIQNQENQENQQNNDNINKNTNNTNNTSPNNLLSVD